MTWAHGGEGTENDPYLVPDADALDDVRDYTAAGVYFKQTANITLADYQEGDGWAPIFLTAHYDGGNYLITNLKIDRGASNNQALFTYNNATISNLKVNGNVKGRRTVAILIARSAGNDVENCHVSGSVESTDTISYAGGLFGDATNGATFSDCSSSASADGGTIVGGFGGRADTSSKIERSFSTGSVSGGSGYVGGFIAIGASSEIYDCYSRGAASGSSTVASFVGRQFRSIIKRCYATGASSFTNRGFAAEVVTGGDYKMVDNYFDSETTGQSSSAGSTDNDSEIPKARLTEDMTYSYSEVDTFTNFDFENVWRDDKDTPLVNNGYPVLQWQPKPIATTTNMILFMGGGI